MTRDELINLKQELLNTAKTLSYEDFCKFIKVSYMIEIPDDPLVFGFTHLRQSQLKRQQ